MIRESVLAWVVKMFGDDEAAPSSRAFRLLEEAMELAQAEGITDAMVDRLRDRVYAREYNDPRFEIGQVGLTLQAYAESVGLDIMVETQREFDRVRLPENQEKLRASLDLKRKQHLVVVHGRGR